MKIKLLIMPILLVLIAVLVIWWIYPGYQDMKIKESELASANAKLAIIKEKNIKAEKLLDTWNNSIEQRSIIEKYIPEQKQEEDVIGSLNSLVSETGLALYDLSVSATEKKNASSVRENTAETEIDAVDSAPTAESFNVALGAAGDYGKIKTLLGKIGSLKRFNSISSLKISSASEQTGALQSDIALNFSYIKRTNSAINPNNKIFLTGVFDIGIADEITQKLLTDIKATIIGSSGRENPFVK